MKKSITDGVDNSNELTMLFKESRIIRERLMELIEAKASSAHKASLAKDKYSSPSWALSQADTVGYQRGLADAISLLQS